MYRFHFIFECSLCKIVGIPPPKKKKGRIEWLAVCDFVLIIINYDFCLCVYIYIQFFYYFKTLVYYFVLRLRWFIILYCTCVGLIFCIAMFYFLGLLILLPWFTSFIASVYWLFCLGLLVLLRFYEMQKQSVFRFCSEYLFQLFVNCSSSSIEQCVTCY